MLRVTESKRMLMLIICQFEKTIIRRPFEAENSYLLTNLGLLDIHN